MKIDQIIRSRRKTFELMIKDDGSLVVRAPLGASEAQIERIVQQRSDWIKKKQELVRHRNQQLPARKFAGGEILLFLGHPYRISIATNQAIPLVVTTKQFRLAADSLPHAREMITRFYLKQASLIIPQRVAYFAQRNRLKYKAVRISDARTRWGSCSSKGSLSFTWRLVMAPPKVIDYVVVHELAHLLERNHAKAFWQKVEAMMPDYLQHKRWLKENGHLLTLDAPATAPRQS
jgi:predicted metal-dependent hydrolase